MSKFSSVLVLNSKSICISIYMHTYVICRHTFIIYLFIIMYTRRTFANLWWAYVSVGMRRPSPHFSLSPLFISLLTIYIHRCRLIGMHMHIGCTYPIYVYTYHKKKKKNNHHNNNKIIWKKKQFQATYTYMHTWNIYTYTILYNYCAVLSLHTYFNTQFMVYSLYRQLSYIFIYTII